MNGRVSRPRLASAAICFALLAVVGVVYSQEEGSLEAVCKWADKLIEDAETALEDCEDFGDCGQWEEILNEATCMSDECWNTDGGTCAA